MSAPATLETAIAIPLANASTGTRTRDAAMFAACGALDAMATAMLLGGVPIAPPLGAIAGTALHLTTVLLVADLTRSRPSRRWLSVAAVLVAPLAGVALAATAWLTQGRGLFVHERPRIRRRHAPTPAALRRIGTALSTFDALECGDAEQRREALSTLSRRSDPATHALLRRAAASTDADLALSAALVLDEIGERAERVIGRSARAEARRGAV